MFYGPEDGHGLPHNPFNAIVTPRPIGWISTRGCDGRDNLAPYCFLMRSPMFRPKLCSHPLVRRMIGMGPKTVSRSAILVCFV